MSSSLDEVKVKSSPIFDPKKHKLKTSIIFNTDESCLRYHVPLTKAIGFKGMKRLCYKTLGGGGSKEAFTVVFGITSEGNAYPPSVIIKGATFTKKKVRKTDTRE